MRILFLVKFYQPFDRGGSEWSTHDLAKSLVKRGHQVTIVTPNYGSKSRQIVEGINVKRMQFPVKLKSPKSSISPFWTNNLIWFLASTFYCLVTSVKSHYDIIHVQNNEFIPAGIITGFFLKKPAIVTFRDYQVLCNLGFCLWSSNKACNFKNYLLKDFRFFFKNYVDLKNVLKYCFLVIANLRSYLMQKILYFFAKRSNVKIVVSQKVADIFSANGINEVKIVHNVVIIKNNPQISTSNQIIYVGKLSKGKGADLLCESLPGILKKLPEAKIKIIGSGHLEKQLKRFTKERNLTDRIEFSGQISHNLVLKTVKKAALVVVPSVWPEPLARSVIEAVLSGIPVVATYVGGNSEIIKNNIYGILVKPNNIQDLKNGIIKAFQNKRRLQKNILKDLTFLRDHFASETVSAYEKIYLNLIKNKQ